MANKTLKQEEVNRADPSGQCRAPLTRAWPGLTSSKWPRQQCKRPRNVRTRALGTASLLNKAICPSEAADLVPPSAASQPRAYCGFCSRYFGKLQGLNISNVYRPIRILPAGSSPGVTTHATLHNQLSQGCCRSVVPLSMVQSRAGNEGLATTRRKPPGYGKSVTKCQQPAAMLH